MRRRRRAFGEGPRPSAASIAVLVAASAAVIAVDAHGGAHGPLEPVRTAVGSVVGPMEGVADAAVRPFGELGGSLRDNRSLRRQVARLTAENARLRSARATDGLNRSRLAELDGLTQAAHSTGYSLVSARVVAMGPAQSFSRTVTIDAGSRSGLHRDMTVLNADGLVGRVLRVTPTTATVLLIVDRQSVVGGRLGGDLEVGFVRGRGDVTDGSPLDLDLVDSAAAPARGDTVTTWGSRDSAPYVAGIPVGTVESVYSTPRDLSKHAVIRPYVDFSALDLVGVVVPAGTHSDRRVIAGGAQ